MSLPGPPGLGLGLGLGLEWRSRNWRSRNCQVAIPFMGLQRRLRGVYMGAPHCKAVLVENFLSPVKIGPKNGGFSGNNRITCATLLNFCLLTPKRHILARNRVVWRTRITCENRFGRLGCRSLEEPPPQKKKEKKRRSRVNILMRNFAHTGKRNPLRDRDQILRVGRYPWHNHVCNFLWRSVKGFGVARGRISRFTIDLRRRPYNTLALPCECVNWKPQEFRFLRQ